jgi:excisionase family DNA binding protein
VSGKLLTTAQVAERLAVTSDTVLVWVQTRRLPQIRLTSRARRYDEDKFEAWLAARSTADAADDREAPTTQPDHARRPGGYPAESGVSFGLPTTPPPQAARTERKP